MNAKKPTRKRRFLIKIYNNRENTIRASARMATKIKAREQAPGKT